MGLIKTDNSFLADKVALRINCLPAKKQLKVLDCYAGSGRIWDQIIKKTGREIQVTPIDISPKQDFILFGDNAKWLLGMNLAKYDVIDLDAYGVPDEQLKIIFDKKYHGVVFVTFIQSGFGRMPDKLLCDLGYTKNMIEKIPTLFSKRGFEKFKDWLSIHGVRRIVHRSEQGKHYLAFAL